MADANDTDLMRDYAERNSEAAFAELVRRHINLVYSVALRFTGNAADAQDVTQAVFIVLTKKAAKLRQRTTLTGWMYETTRLTARQTLRSKNRRQAREHEAYMQSTLNDVETDGVWRKLSPILEEGMSRLNENERTLLALRFFENKSVAEASALLGIHEWATRKRVDRAVEKLRKFFARRGVVLSAAGITAAIAANSVQAAPAILVKSITAGAMIPGVAAGGSTSTLVKGALKIMAWTKMKTAIAVGTAVLLAGGTTTIVVKTMVSPSIDESFWKPDSRVFQKVPPVLILRPTRSEGGSGSITMGEKTMRLDATLVQLLGVAYGLPESQIILPDGAPQDRFDLMLTLNDHPKEALQAELKKRFGLNAHLETRDVDVYTLKMKNPNAPGLSPTADGNAGSVSSSMRSFSSSGTLPPDLAARIHVQSGASTGEQITMNNQTLANFTQYLGRRLGKHVIDETGSTDHFDIKLQVRAKEDESKEDALKRSLIEQLGLELAAGTAPDQVLVVESASKMKR